MRWVKLWRYCTNHKDLPSYVHRRVKRGIWTEGIHTKTVEGETWVDLAEAVPWLKREKRATYVYIVGEAGADRPIKIGIADNLEKRLIGLQIGNARRLEIRHSFLFDSVKLARDAELAAHRHFKNSALCGEWFDIDDAVAAAWITATYASRGQLRRQRSRNEVVYDE
jgi:hypothetical protein